MATTKLYPPHIEGTLPAFYLEKTSKDSNPIGAYISVPFSMNVAVSSVSVKGFYLRLRTASSGSYLFEPVYSDNYDLDKGIVIFELNYNQANALREGQYYKLQIAYCQDLSIEEQSLTGYGDVGYYSTVGVAKCVSKAQVSIMNLEINNINFFSSDFIGLYDQSDCTDKSEKVYSFQFLIYDDNNNLFWESDEILHNHLYDVDYDSSTDRININNIVPTDVIYSIQYKVTTLNNLEIYSPRYKITNRNLVSIGEVIYIIPEISNEEGVINIRFQGEEKANHSGELEEQRVSGNFLLSRTDDLSNYKVFVNIQRFKLDNQKPSDISIQDFSIEHGRRYKYTLQQYNAWGVYSERIYANPEKKINLPGGDIDLYYQANFDDAFLYDGEKILKIRYNPEIATFKTTILESKTNTIGGKYPYITRNGITNYKEFPLGGLLAQELDINYNEKFYNQDMYENNDYGYGFIKVNYGTAHRHSTPTLQDVYDENNYSWTTKSDLPENALYEPNSFSDDRLVLERDFKLNVLDWLNNGKPKLFKSPYEGSYIVRLMNVSLQPVNELGRVLHKFTSTAYEIAEYSYSNLIKYGVIDNTVIDNYLSLWKSYNLSDNTIGTDKNIEDNITINSTTGDISIKFNISLMSFVIQDAMPGTLIKIYPIDSPLGTEIMIGATGSYTYDGYSGNIGKIEIFNNLKLERLIGILHCYYKDINPSGFESITRTTLKAVPIRQFIGVNPNMVRFIDNIISGNGSENVKTNTIDDIQDYNWRDLYKYISGTSAEGYSINKSQVKQDIKLTYRLDATELLDQINISFNNYKNHKVDVVKVEQANFKLRPLINVYTTTELVIDDDPINIQASFAPYEEPHPISSLINFGDLIDAYTIFDVNYLNNGEWTHLGYYDAYYQAWTDGPKWINYTQSGQDSDLGQEYNTFIKIGYYTPLLKNGEIINDFINQVKTKDNEGKIIDAPIDISRKKEEPVNHWKLRDREDKLNDINQKYFYLKEYLQEQDSFDSPTYFGFKNFVETHCYLRKENTETYINYSYVDLETFLNDLDKIYIIQYTDKINLYPKGEYHLENIEEDIASIKIGNGVIAELTYVIQESEFYVETENHKVKLAKEAYLAALNKYHTLMELYPKHKLIKTEYEKYKALVAAYTSFLYGTNSFVFVDGTDIGTLQRLTTNLNERETLNLLQMYENTYINSSLDSDVLDDLVTLKMSAQLDTFNQLQLYSSAPGQYEIINTNDIHKVGESGTIVYKQQDPYGDIAYFQSGEIADKEYFDFNENGQAVMGEGNPIGYFLYPLTLITDIDILSTLDELMDSIDYQELYDNELFLNSSELPYSKNKYSITLYEDESLQLLSGNKKYLPEYDETATEKDKKDLMHLVISELFGEGIESKLRIVTSTIEEFNSSNDTLILEQEDKKQEYITKYNLLMNDVNQYNNRVYTQWAVSAISFLLSLSNKDGERIYDKDKIKTIFTEQKKVATDTEERLVSRIDNYKNAFASIVNDNNKLYPEIKSNQLVINDANNGDIDLDNHLAQSLIKNIGEYLFNLLILIDYYNVLKEENEIDEKESGKITELFNQIKPFLENKKLNYFQNKLEEFNNLYNIESTYEKTEETQQQRQAYGLKNLATMSNIYDDLSLAYEVLTSNDEIFGAIIRDINKVLASANELNSIKTLIENKDKNPISFKVIDNYYSLVNKQSFNNIKEVNKYMYREILILIKTDFEDKEFPKEYQENIIPIFIFNPYSQNEKFLNDDNATFMSIYNSRTKQEQIIITQTYLRLCNEIIRLLETYETADGQELIELLQKYQYVGREKETLDKQLNNIFTGSYYTSFKALLDDAQNYLIQKKDYNAGNFESFDFHNKKENNFLWVNGNSNDKEDKLELLFENNNIFLPRLLKGDQDGNLKIEFQDEESPYYVITAEKGKEYNLEYLRFSNLLVLNLNTNSNEYQFSTIANGTMANNGYFYEYLQAMYTNIINDNNQIIQQAEVLQKLYLKQYNNYLKKQEKYLNYFNIYENDYNTLSAQLSSYEIGSLEEELNEVKKKRWAYLDEIAFAYNQSIKEGGETNNNEQ